MGELGTVEKALDSGLWVGGRMEEIVTRGHEMRHDGDVNEENEGIVSEIDLEVLDFLILELL